MPPEGGVDKVSSPKQCKILRTQEHFLSRYLEPLTPTLEIRSFEKII